MRRARSPTAVAAALACLVFAVGLLIQTGFLVSTVSDGLTQSAAGGRRSLLDHANTLIPRDGRVASDVPRAPYILYPRSVSGVRATRGPSRVVASLHKRDIQYVVLTAASWRSLGDTSAWARLIYRNQ